MDENPHLDDKVARLWWVLPSVRVCWVPSLFVGGWAVLRFPLRVTGEQRHPFWQSWRPPTQVCEKVTVGHVTCPPTVSNNEVRKDLSNPSPRRGRGIQAREGGRGSACGRRQTRQQVERGEATFRPPNGREHAPHPSLLHRGADAYRDKAPPKRRFGTLPARLGAVTPGKRPCMATWRHYFVLRPSEHRVWVRFRHPPASGGRPMKLRKMAVLLPDREGSWQPSNQMAVAKNR